MARSSRQASTATKKARPKPRAKAKPTPPYRERFVLYEVDVGKLQVTVAGTVVDVSPALSDGRCSYRIIELLLSHLTGISMGTQGAGSDLMGQAANQRYEVKSFKDEDDYPRAEKIHTAASALFARNCGVEQYEEERKRGYKEGLAECVRTGYVKNDFYIYTNTGEWRKKDGSNTNLKYIVIPTKAVLELLKKKKKDDETKGKEPDPRTINRSDLLARQQGKTVPITEW
jgi:hypothetical protein